MWISRTWSRYGSRRKRRVSAGAPAAPNGFTLVEVIVGITLMTVGILCMAALAVAVAQANRGAANRTRADQLLHEKIEAFRSFEYDQIVSGADTVQVAGVTFVRNWTVSDDTPEADLKHLEILGTWQERESVFSTRTTTLVGKY